MMRQKLQVFAGRSNPELARKICTALKVKLGNAEITRFPDGEINVKINDDVRGADVFVVQSTCEPVNENLMELLIIIDCLKRASVDRVTAVIPYFGYARQDRKAEGRVPITAKLVANILTISGADRVLTMDLHAAQIQGFFDIPVDHLYAARVLANHFRVMKLSKPTVVAPDVGGVKMARGYAKRLDATLAIVDKRREGPKQIEVSHVIGDVAGRNVVIVDDIIATGTTIAKAASNLKERGAKSVCVCATHPVLCDEAIDKLGSAPIDEVVVTDTIPLGNKARPFVKQLSVARLLAEAILRIHESTSVSALFM
jgi:ribose-phosphate pyrophosphokinase